MSANTAAFIGALTALFSATIAVAQFDIKKVLAYSTISQLGFMLAAVALGGYVAGLFHLVTHAFFKALLFLGAGSVIQGVEHAHEASHGEHAHNQPFDPQDMRNMGGTQASDEDHLLGLSHRRALAGRRAAALGFLLEG